MYEATDYQMITLLLVGLFAGAFIAWIFLLVAGREPVVVDPWLPIDSAPRNGMSILVTDGCQVDKAYFDYDDWCAPHSSANSIPYSPTHWKNLPDGHKVKKVLTNKGLKLGL